MGHSAILRHVVVGSVLATSWIPCVVAGSLVFPFMSAKGHLFRLLVDLALAGTAILAVAHPSPRPRVSPILVAAVTFVAWLGLADLAGVCPVSGLLGDLERMEGWLTHLHLLGYLLVLPVALSSELSWRLFCRLSLTASLVVTAVALAQLAGVYAVGSPEGRVDGTLGNPSFLAAYLAFHIWLAAHLALRRSCGTRTRMLLAAITVAEGLALLFTATRSAVLGLIAGALVAACLVLWSEPERTRVRRLAALVAVGGSLLVAGFVLLRGLPVVTSSPVLGRFAAISPSELTSQSRLLAWGAALEGAAERPWLGWGQGSFPMVYARHYDPRLCTQDPFFDRPHNVFLQWLVAGGVPALLAFCSILAALLAAVWRRGAFDAVERSMLTGLAAGYVVHALFLFDTLTSYLLGVATLAYVHWRVTSSRRSSDFVVGGRRLGWAVVAVAVTAAAGASVVLTWRTVAAERALLRAVRPDAGGIEATQAWFERALRHRTPATPKVRERLLTTAVEVGRARPADAAALSELTSLAYREMSVQVAACPLDVRSQVALASFLWRFGAFDEARSLLDRAHGLAPRMQHVLFEIGALELERGRFEQALGAFRRAYELETAWVDARNRYAAAAIVAGQRRVAEELLVPAEGTLAVGDEWLIAAFRAAGDLPNLVAALEARLQTVPADGREASRLRAALGEARRALVERVMVDGFELGTTEAWSVAER